MNTEEIWQRLSKIAQCKALKLPKLHNNKTLIIQPQNEMLNCENFRFSIFKIPSHSIKIKQFSLNYTQELGKRKKKFCIQSQQKLKKRIKTEEGKKQQQKLNFHLQMIDPVDLLKKKKQQILKKYQVSQTIKSQRLKCPLNRITRKQAKAYYSNRQMGTIKSQKSESNIVSDNNRQLGKVKSQMNEGNIQMQGGSKLISGTISFDHKNLNCAKYSQFNLSCFRQMSLYKYAYKYQSSNYCSGFSSNKHQNEEQIGSHCLKRNHTHSIKNYINKTQQMSTLDPWETQITVDL